MKLKLSTEQQQWADEVAAFLSDFGHAGSDPWSLTAWRREMLATGWHIGDWPKAHGGSEWPPWRSYLWLQALHGHFHRYVAPAGLNVAAPLLLHSGSKAQQDRWLPGIADLSGHWCVAYEPGVGLVNGRLSGELTSVSGFESSDLLLLPVSPHEYAIVPADAPGIENTRANTHGGDRVDHLTFDQVVPLDTMQTEQHHALLGQVMGQGRHLSRKLGEIEAALAEQSEDEDLRRRVSEAEIGLEALQAMELRYVDAASRDLPRPYPLSLIDARRITLGLELAELHMDSLGYFALPNPDLDFDHNLGPIGLDGAQTAVREWLEQSFAQKSASARPDLYGKLDG